MQIGGVVYQLHSQVREAKTEPRVDLRPHFFTLHVAQRRLRLEPDRELLLLLREPARLRLDDLREPLDERELDDRLLLILRDPPADLRAPPAFLREPPVFLREPAAVFRDPPAALRAPPPVDLRAPVLRFREPPDDLREPPDVRAALRRPVDRRAPPPVARSPSIIASSSPPSASVPPAISSSMRSIMSLSPRAMLCGLLEHGGSQHLCPSQVHEFVGSLPRKDGRQPVDGGWRIADGGWRTAATNYKPPF